MDLRVYFHKIRTIEATIPGDQAVVVSLETADGGREGRLTEVNRESAAKLVVQGKSRLASDEETAEYRASVRAAKRAADEQLLRDRLQLHGLIQADADLIRSALEQKE